MATKNCPYCHQPQQVDALKCTQCSEYLRCKFCAASAFNSQPPPRDTVGFGQHLLDRQLVTLDELLTALDVQMSRRKRIGVVAREQKKLSPSQVYTVLNAQLNANKRFGQLAVESGLLTVQELDTLLMQQRATTVPIGQMLCELGFITKDLLDKELDEYESVQFAIPASNLPPKSLRPAPPPAASSLEFPEDW